MNSVCYAGCFLPAKVLLFLWRLYTFDVFALNYTMVKRSYILVAELAHPISRVELKSSGSLTNLMKQQWKRQVSGQVVKFSLHGVQKEVRGD